MERLSATELAHWMAYYRLEPWDNARVAVQIAQIERRLFAALSGPHDPIPELADFLTWDP